MTPTIVRSHGAIILYDAECGTEFSTHHFRPDWWRLNGQVIGEAHGRGSVFFVRQGEHQWALRHFFRGGWVARLSPDRYFWLGLKRTRMWREWEMLAGMQALGLPVPRPVATRVIRTGLLYRGDLITQLLDGARTLAHLVRFHTVSEPEWYAVGLLLGRFQAHGVRHDDINVSNVLRDAAGNFSLIDFDKAHFARRGAWCERNLARFHRSLVKLRTRFPSAHFTPADWAALRRGYDFALAGGVATPEHSAASRTFEA